jgi:hypothetical protein
MPICLSHAYRLIFPSSPRHMTRFSPFGHIRDIQSNINTFSWHATRCILESWVVPPTDCRRYLWGGPGGMMRVVRTSLYGVRRPTQAVPAAVQLTPGVDTAYANPIHTATMQ